jgi:hypothetical protein
VNPFALPRGTVEWPLEEVAIIRVPHDGRSDRRKIELRPARRARPFALLTWGCRPESAIYSIAIEENEQLIQATPGGAFPCMLDYVEFCRLLDSRQDGHDAVRAVWRLFSFQGLMLDNIERGARLTIDLDGPFEHVVFLARMPVLAQDCP